LSRETPFELSVSVLEVGGLYGVSGMVKVEVAVGDVIAGITSGRSTNASAPGTLSGSLSLTSARDVTDSTRLLWSSRNQFSIPLTSLDNHGVSLTLYCETELKAPAVIGVAKNDPTLGSLFWSQMNRCFAPLLSPLD
jgi:hypothetical protein